MLARKAEYMSAAGKPREWYMQKRSKAEKKHIVTFMKRIGLLLGLVFSIILASISIAAVKSNYTYALMQEKQQVRQLQRDNDALRIDIARLDTAERIYTMATTKLGMTAPAHILYGPPSQTEAVSP
ncbi:cell division protein FtsL [uncultured Megasphaera sp.]|uniref:cell division protein FtsL n=1 Tax=uncultured Megasphaera sp. TaxID=165188 RepID=UPI002658A326|nr:cell division protein FtsL [uncultured Megasphaera sp.]